MKITVIGTGYVGLVSGACFAEIGHNVTCIDTDHDKIEKLRKGIIPIHEEGLEEIVKRQSAKGTLHFTTDYSETVPNADIVLIAVGTPASEDGAADLRQVYKVAEQISPLLKAYTVIVDKSTVPVGTAEQVQAIIAQHTDQEFDVVSNPEILREGVAVQDFMNPSRIIIGSSSNKAAAKMLELYAPLSCQKIVMSPRSAELTKYAANSFIATKISYINELARLAEKAGASIEEVALGIGTDPRIGMGSLRPGPGWGGSCFPKDVRALMHMAHEQGMDLPIVEAAHHSNTTMREHIVKRLEDALGEISGKTIGVLGLAFKGSTDDIRESPAIAIIKHLSFRGAIINAYDPLAARGEDEHIGTFKRVISPEVAAQDADALIIATEWESFKHIDLIAISKAMRGNILFDARNMLQTNDKRLEKFTYLRIGN